MAETESTISFAKVHSTLYNDKQTELEQTRRMLEGGSQRSVLRLELDEVMTQRRESLCSRDNTFQSLALDRQVRLSSRSLPYSTRVEVEERMAALAQRMQDGNVPIAVKAAVIEPELQELRSLVIRHDQENVECLRQGSALNHNISALSSKAREMHKAIDAITVDITGSLLADGGAQSGDRVNVSLVSQLGAIIDGSMREAEGRQDGLEEARRAGAEKYCSLMESDRDRHMEIVATRESRMRECDRVCGEMGGESDGAYRGTSGDSGNNEGMVATCDMLLSYMKALIKSPGQQGEESGGDTDALDFKHCLDVLLDFQAVGVLPPTKREDFDRTVEEIKDVRSRFVNNM